VDKTKKIVFAEVQNEKNGNRFNPVNFDECGACFSMPEKERASGAVRACRDSHFDERQQPDAYNDMHANSHRNHYAYFYIHAAGHYD
jgi:hypothetical protein